MKRFLPTLALATLLGACSLGLGGKAPPYLLTLAPTAVASASPARNVKSSDAVVIGTPLVPQAIATARIPVADGQTAIAYVKDAAWVEPPARLFQRLMAETVRARSGRLVLDSRQMSGPPGFQLSGQLLHFGVDARSSQAVVIYDATLSRDGGKQYESRRFESKAPVGTVDAASTGRALNKAANEVAGQVADWIG